MRVDGDHRAAVLVGHPHVVGELLRDDRGVGGARDTRQQYHQIRSIEPEHEVARPDRLADPVRRVLEEQVANVVPEGLVDLLEAAQAHEQQRLRHRRGSPPRALDLAREQLLERAPVIEPGRSIAVLVAREPRLDFGEVGDVVREDERVGGWRARPVVVGLPVVGFVAVRIERDVQALAHRPESELVDEMDLVSGEALVEPRLDRVGEAGGAPDLFDGAAEDLVARTLDRLAVRVVDDLVSILAVDERDEVARLIDYVLIGVSHRRQPP